MALNGAHAAAVTGDRTAAHPFRPLVLLSIWIVLIYGNTFHASWQLDDYSIIVDNPRLHLTEITPETIRSVFTAWVDRGAYDSSRIYRPIPCLTFALNWYVHGSNVFGYHLVNLSIHLLNACLLYFLLLRLMRIRRNEDRPDPDVQAVALLTTALWAIHPIQTQAVTYVVQRMAMLAATFSLAAMLFYIRARIGRSLMERVRYSVLSMACFAGALGSKENAILLPGSLILMEVLFFSQGRNKGARIAAVLIGLAGIGLAGAVALKGDLSWLTAGYSFRPFTLSERLMTESRVVVHYLSQMAFPSPQRLSICHDVPVSTGLLQPWTTLPSMVAILFLAVFALVQADRRPVTAFGVLFFLLNHVAESTVLPLELVFEHRNYLPSLFLFWPAADFLVPRMAQYRTSNPFRFRILAFFIGFLFIWLGSNTYLRNEAWRTEKSLWEDAMAKAPGQSRPPQNLATGYYEKVGRYDAAIALYRHALTLRGPSRDNWRAGIHNNLGILLQKMGKTDQAIAELKKAVEIEPRLEIARYNLVLALIKNRQWEEADRHATRLLESPHNRKEHHNLKGFILIFRGRPEEAETHLKAAVRDDPFYFKALLNLGGALTLLDRYDEGLAYYLRADKVRPDHIFTLLYLVQNRLMAGDPAGAEPYLEKLLAIHPLGEITGYVDGHIRDRLILPFARDLLAPFLADYLIGIGRDFRNEPAAQGRSPASGHAGNARDI